MPFSNCFISSGVDPENVLDLRDNKCLSTIRFIDKGRPLMISRWIVDILSKTDSPLLRTVVIVVGTGYPLTPGHVQPWYTMPLNSLFKDWGRHSGKWISTCLLFALDERDMGVEWDQRLQTSFSALHTAKRIRRIKLPHLNGPWLR